MSIMNITFLLLLPAELHEAHLIGKDCKMGYEIPIEDGLWGNRYVHMLGL